MIKSQEVCNLTGYLLITFMKRINIQIFFFQLSNYKIKNTVEVKSYTVILDLISLLYDKILLDVMWV